jgi:hypothetical protein
MAKSLSEGLQQLRERREETARLVGQLRAERVDARSIEKRSLGEAIDKTTARANQIAILLEKLGKLLDWAKSASVLAHFLR